MKNKQFPIILFIGLVLIISCALLTTTSTELVSHSNPTSLSFDGTGSSFVDAKTLVFGSNIDALPGPAPDNSIYYEIGLSDGEYVTFSLDGDGGTDFDLYLYDMTQTQISASTTSSRICC